MPGLLENNNTQFNESSFLYVYSISKSSYMYTRKSIDGGHSMKTCKEIWFKNMIWTCMVVKNHHIEFCI